MDSISLTALHRVLPDGLSVEDTSWLLAMSLVVPPPCAIVAAHDAIHDLCEQLLSGSHQ